jgi:hypothetical protein
VIECLQRSDVEAIIRVPWHLKLLANAGDSTAPCSASAVPFWCIERRCGADSVQNSDVENVILGGTPRYCSGVYHHQGSTDFKGDDDDDDDER